jgi:pimeloyl-ACP methyl ester carboxylesterase
MNISRVAVALILLGSLSGSLSACGPAGPADRFADVGDVRIHYLEWGTPENPPMILLHGIGRIARTFEPVARHFADDYRVIAVDMRGHGDSAWSPDGSYTVEDYTGDLIGIVEQLDLAGIVVWGNSTGGRVAQMFAGKVPDRVAAVIVEDVGPERPRAIANRLAVQVEREDAEGWESVDAVVAELVETNPRTGREVLEAWANFGSHARDDGRIVWKRDPAIANDFVPLQHWPVVGQITAPIIYILGGASTIVPPETQRELERVLPQVEIVTMPGLGHYPSQEEPEAFVAIVDRFLGR